MIADSGLFDPDWYLSRYPDVGILGLDPFEHFIKCGSEMLRSPRALFDARFYCRMAADSADALVHPLLHYLKVGRFENLDPHPLFKVGWYLSTNPDVRESGVEPLSHFLHHGGMEGRGPHPAFPTHRVLERCPQLRQSGVNPLNYYLSGEWDDDPCPELSAFMALQRGEESACLLPAPSGGEFRGPSSGAVPKRRLFHDAPVSTDIRAIAIYLPQFHPIPENDEWWGKGFTEWTNVRRATPQYDGHYQPHVPHPDLGYYDLNDSSVLELQASMARAAGIEGFCFYYYWFNGRRLLNMPTDRLIATGKPNFPFCFCWANENWTRTWDGGDKEILVGQQHSPESDELFILDLLTAFRDPRYIRVDGKPLLVVYRPGLLPDPAATARHWRETCRREGIGEIFLARMQMFDWELEGRESGYDAVIQFAPVSRPVSPSVKSLLRIHEPAEFKGEIYDYRLSATHYAFESIGPNLWPGVCPSWDNTARRMERGHSWIYSSPEVYREWLATVVGRTRRALPASQRFIFINAWNEWAEGCHLEPDERHGYAWLNATRLALSGERPPDRLRVLVVGHDASRAGAQMVLLHMLREWKAQNLCDPRLVLLGDGVLRRDYEAVVDTLVLSDFAEDIRREEAVQAFLRPVPDVVLGNTVVSGPFLSNLKHLGIPVVAYIHELEKSIERWAPGAIMRTTVESSDYFIAVSTPVADNLHRLHGIPIEKIFCVNEYVPTCYRTSPERLQTLRDELAIQPHEKIVFGCGTVDWRKGPDLFVRTALKVLERVPEARFIWIGGETGDHACAVARQLAEDHRIQFIGVSENPRDYFALGHAFFLSSREDPFPLVALEAADAGLPIVCFADAGGMPEFVGNTCGRTVPFENIQEAADALHLFIINKHLCESVGSAARESVRLKHDASIGSAEVFSILEQSALNSKKSCENLVGTKVSSENPLVSVIVPNFNHADFLIQRLDSIVFQTVSDLEIILLDDKSTDGSLEILEKFLLKDPRARLVTNSRNSGSTFKQWHRGILEAKGKYIWIAESDDSADPTFLATLIDRLERNPNAVLATCRPCMVDRENNRLGTPSDWFTDIGGVRWETDFSSTSNCIISSALAYKNAILNASGVLFRNRAGLAALVDSSMRLCGDWLFWVRILAFGDFEYVAEPLNFWRIDSSNARTRVPGEVESVEGSRVLAEVARILQIDESAKNRLLESFKRRCDVWINNSKLETRSVDSTVGNTRTIAIHLPQFHPFKENDEWWGTGFTEWTNVRKARPIFSGHAQPRVPADLGYYDLRSSEVRKAQAALARDHGVDGFCYYHYWFMGKRLMKEPLDAIFESGEPDFPFCLCWANETWSRRWLGEDCDVLIEQTYSHEDNESHSQFLAKIFADRRYIRLGGRPLFLIYRPTHMPFLEHFISTLRRCSLLAGAGEPFLLGCSSHAEGTDMRTLGLDGTMDFQPKLGFLPGAFSDEETPDRLGRNRALGVNSASLRLYDAKDFRVRIEAFRDQLDYPVYPSVYVSWDNTPRRGENGIVLLNDSPSDFAKSLNDARRYVNSPKFQGEKVVFINAWNEWAEGNYLEPDIVSGKEFLFAIRK